MSKKIFTILSFLVVFAMLLAACAQPTEAPPAEEPAAEEPAAEEPAEPEEAAFRVGFVTDTGGIDDQSFNTTQWEGVERAVEELGVEAMFIQSDEATQYESNLTEFSSQGYELIIASGFFLGGDLAKTAAQYPDINYTIVDYTYLFWCWIPARYGAL